MLWIIISHIKHLKNQCEFVIYYKSYFEDISNEEYIWKTII